MADDPDAMDSLTWTKTGDDAGDFTITRNSSGHGELKFSAVPNYENEQTTAPTTSTT